MAGVKSKKISTVVYFLIFFVSYFLFCPSALAEEDTCDCWCGKEGVGARSVQTQLASACDTACEAQGSGFEKIICTNNLRAKPPTDLTCWTDNECSLQNGLWGGSTEIGEPTPKHCYGGTPKENYCYPDPEPMPLEILIGAPGQEVAQVNDLAEYVAAWYQWLLYAGVIIAVVMIMIGGVQYMVGKGMGSIDSAKKRIQSAIIGLVILFGAYVILATVNPQLVLLQIPKYPMIKQVVYVDDSVKCEKLIELGYTLEYENRVYTKNSLGGDIDCGKQAEVSLDPGGDESDIENCFWSYCENGKSCLMPQSTD
ncbi:MAG: pilin, partial [Candidatus Uhrbacteria bacterium]